MLETAAISAGGLVGAGNQYLILLIVSVAARFNFFHLAPELGFMESWWFIGLVGLFWVVTILPAYASLLSPGVMNVVNTITNILSGFFVPISGALLSLTTAGVIVSMHPDLQRSLETLQLFGSETAAASPTAWLIAGGGAVAAVGVNLAKFAAKPLLSAATATTGTTAAPAFATAENAASIVLTALIFLLTELSPWLLVGLLAGSLVIILGLIGYGIYQLWKLGKGAGKAMRLIKSNPKAGWAVLAESLVWGCGWMIWQKWEQAIPRLLSWGLWLVAVIMLIPAIAATASVALIAVPPLALLASIVALGAQTAVVLLGLMVGLRSAAALMAELDRVAPRTFMPEPSAVAST
jgi:hypothetical protein